MFQRDPFSGHVVLRSTDTPASGSQYKLWTTLKVPHGFSMRKHADFLRDQVGAKHYRLMPAKGIFALGVGHTRRKIDGAGREIGRAAPRCTPCAQVKLTELEWRVLHGAQARICRRTKSAKISGNRARSEADLPLPVFFEVAESLDERKVIGRFSTFLEHVKPTATGERVTRFNALFHWAVPAGREIEAGREIGRHHILTHCYWREGGPEFNHVNIMAVAHGTDRDLVRAHKAAIDEHLREHRHALQLHQRLLGRPQRNQALGNRPGRLRRLVPRRPASIPNRCGSNCTAARRAAATSPTHNPRHPELVEGSTRFLSRRGPNFSIKAAENISTLPRSHTRLILRQAQDDGIGNYLPRRSRLDHLLELLQLVGLFEHGVEAELLVVES